MENELTTKDTKTSTELINLVTDTKQRLFLENYAKCNRRITQTAKAIGVGETTVHDWRHRSPLFSEALEALKKELDVTRIEDYLENIRSITFDKDVPPQTRLIGSFFELKALDNRYKDRQDSGPQVATQIIIHTSIPEPKYEVTDYEEIDAERTS